MQQLNQEYEAKFQETGDMTSTLLHMVTIKPYRLMGSSKLNAQMVILKKTLFIKVFFDKALNTSHNFFHICNSSPMHKTKMMTASGSGQFVIFQVTWNLFVCV